MRSNFLLGPFLLFPSYDLGLRPCTESSGSKAFRLLSGGFFPLLYEISHFSIFRGLPLLFPHETHDHQSVGSGPPGVSQSHCGRRRPFNFLSQCWSIVWTQGLYGSYCIIYFVRKDPCLLQLQAWKELGQKRDFAVHDRWLPIYKGWCHHCHMSPQGDTCHPEMPL